MTAYSADKRFALLSFDLEEFDIPEEYGRPVPEAAQYSVTREGLARLLPLLDKFDIRATFFTTASFAKANMSLVAEVAKTHEIASHGLTHKGVASPGDVADSKKSLEDLLSVEVAGFRSPRLQPVASAPLRDAGYVYNSSDNPIYLPGRYNNFLMPRTAYKVDGVVQVPISATPLIRFPLFWLAFKNTPLPLMLYASRWCLRADGYVNIFFHPWEFSDLSEYTCLPWFVRSVHSGQMAAKLDSYLSALARRASFTTLREFALSFPENDSSR